MGFSWLSYLLTLLFLRWGSAFLISTPDKAPQQEHNQENRFDRRLGVMPLGAFRTEASLPIVPTGTAMSSGKTGCNVASYNLVGDRAALIAAWHGDVPFAPPLQ